VRLIFVDSSAFIALKDSSDRDHTSANSTFLSLIQEGVKFITSNFVFDETYTFLRRKAGWEVATGFGEFLQKSNIIQYLRITEEMENSAWEIAVRYKDKYFSFTDCVSFAVMKKLDINEAFTFDEHFKQFGFTVV
jgi:hypothetical protein